MINNQLITPLDLRKQACEAIIDQAVFISRVSEGSVSLDWIMSQPIWIRVKYHEFFVKQLQEREKRQNSKSPK